jgi:hypothetical protein
MLFPKSFLSHLNAAIDAYNYPWRLKMLNSLTPDE